MGFKSLKINNWKQFDAIDIEFHDRLTVLTGANASGKTTLLNLLAGHFGWDLRELSTPTKVQETGKIEFLKPVPEPLALIGKAGQEWHTIGEVIYTDGSKTDITIPYQSSPTYGLNFPSFKGPRGMYIPSDRPEFVYQSVDQIPEGRTRDRAFDMLNSSHKRARGRSRDIKEILIGWGIFGFDSKIIVGDKEFENLYVGFENLLRKILPRELGFKEFSVRVFEVVLVTESGEFMIDGVSGGIGALIDLALRIYLLSGGTDALTTVLIDEVETHLHAAMQRELMPSFLEAFPNVQFIVSTHSPLIVSSVRDSSVYVLRHNDEHKVESIKLDIAKKARGAADILRDVLGVPFTMPVWVEEKLNEINEKYLKLDIDEDTFTSLRKELAEIGLEDLVPYSIDKILSSR